MALSLKKNFGFALFGNLGYAASQYIILLIFIKLYSMEDVGQFIYAGAFTTPLMTALDMQLRNFYITDDEKNLSFRDYVSFRTLTSIIGVIFMISAAWLLKPEFFAVILIVTLIKTFESQLDLIYGVYQKKHHLNYVAYSRIIRGIVAIAIVTIVSLVFRNIILSLLAYLGSWILLYFFYERRQVVKRKFIINENLQFSFLNRRTVKYFLVICLPVFCAIFIDKYYLNYPRISVERLLGVEALAVFGSLLYFKSLGGQFISSIAQAAMPRLADYVRNQNKKQFVLLVAKMVSAGIILGGILTLGAYFFGSNILAILYNEQYAKYADVLVWVLIGTTITFGYTFITSAFTALRKQWVRLPVSIIMLSIMVGLFYFRNVNNLLDVAKIVLFTEVINLVIFYILFVVFINSLFKGNSKEIGKNLGI